jgi:predicted HTH transcriptional regulator
MLSLSSWQQQPQLPVLPQLPRHWVLNEKVPFKESNTVEFKRVSIFSGLFNLKSSKCSGLPKYRETINAFLNSGGGYLIMGVLDDGTIVGAENVTDDMIDKCKLWLDSCFNGFMYKDGSSLNPTQISLTVNIFPVINSDLKIIVIQVINTGQLLNVISRCGALIYRLNASNYKMVSEPIYRRRDVKGMIDSIQKHMQSLINLKHREIKDLQEKHLEEIKSIIEREGKITRGYMEKISESLYKKYQIEGKNDNLCSKVVRYLESFF